MNVCKWRIRISPFPLRRAGLLGVLLCILISAGCSRPQRFRIVIQQTTPFLESVARQVAERLEPHGYRVDISAGIAASAGLTDAMILNVAAPDAAMKPESFEITPIKTEDYWLLRVTGAGPRAALWGALQAADQMASQGGLGAVRPAKAEAMLAIRGRALALPPSGSSAFQQRGANRDEWRNYFDLLVRSRFNSVFFEIHDDLRRFVPSDASSLESANGDGRAEIERLHEAFRLARERGLNPYAVLEKSALAEWIGKPEASSGRALIASTTAAGASTTPGGASDTASEVTESSRAVRRPLPDVVAAFMQNYREMEGLAIAPEIAAPAERREAWLAENIFSPFSKNNDKRTVIIGVNGEWWPARAALGDAATLPPVYLWAAMEKLEEAPADVPVLWQVDEGPEELLPWRDPDTVRDTLQKLGGKKAAGFLEPARSASRESASEFSDEQPPDMEREWFREMLWGRLGYAPDAPGNFWEEQFASHFGGDAGRLAVAAAVHGSRVLAMLQSKRAAPGLQSAAGTGATDRASSRESRSGDLRDLEQAMFRPVSGGMQRDLIADALAQKGLLMDDGPEGAGFSPPGDALEHEARQMIAAANGAAHSSSTKGGATEEFFQRLQSIARLGLTDGEMLRASRLLAQFAVGGEGKLRQQAIDMLDQAQKSLSSEGDKVPRAIAGVASSLGAQINSVRNLATTMQPWKWETTAWEVGTREAWQPSSPNEVPAAQTAQRVEMSRLTEFGAFGSVGWIGSINRRLRSAFFQVPANGNPASAAPGSMLVAKTSLDAKRDGRLVLRVISDEPLMVWVNRRRAARITAQQFPWVPAASSARPLGTQLFASLIPAGANEVVVAVAEREKWPLVSVNVLLPPDTKDIIGVPLKEAARYEGGVAYEAATEGLPQAHIGVAESEAGMAADTATSGGMPLAVLRFRIRDPGFYRLRFYSFWPSAERSGLALAIDGTPAKSNVGRNDATYQKWHWVPLDGVFDLGSGEHTLAIGEWKRGAMLGAIEALPDW